MIYDGLNSIFFLVKYHVGNTIVYFLGQKTYKLADENIWFTKHKKALF